VNGAGKAVQDDSYTLLIPAKPLCIAKISVLTK